MLLNEQQNGNDFIAFYDSSNILMSKYIYDQRKLAVIFAKGQQYVYEGVIPYHYQRFKTSQSQGKGLKDFITANYKAIKAEGRLDGEILEGIKKQVEDLKKQR